VCVCVFEAVFERVMMPEPRQHLVGDAGIVDPAAEAHPVRYLCDSFMRLKTKMRANKVKHIEDDSDADYGNILVNVKQTALTVSNHF